MNPTFVRAAMEPLIQQGITDSLDGKYRFHRFVGASPTPAGIGILYIPIGEMAAVEDFVLSRCGGQEADRQTYEIVPEDG